MTTTVPFRRPRRGAAAVEFALVLPFLRVVLLGLFEVSRVLIAKEAMSNAAQRAARTASLPGMTNTQLQADVEDIMAASSLSGYTVTVLVNDAAGDVANAKRNDKLSVRVSMPTSKVLLIASIFIPPATVQSETVVMLRQG